MESIVNLLQSVKDFFLSSYKGKPPKSILCCVSGGPDSVVLLDILNHLTPQFGWKLGIAHFNHKLRGRESDDDADFVKRIGDELNLPTLVKEWERGFDNENLEDSARRARYEWFIETAKSEKFELIATGHNLDDQAETVLHNIFRGSGIRGLSGIKIITPIMENIYLVRPLLKGSRKEILEYLHENKLEYRIDSTNMDTKFTRNRIRHEILPLLV